MTKELDDTYSQGKLEEFFNGTENASTLAKHNNHLAQMIADATVQHSSTALRYLAHVNTACYGP